MFRVLVSTLFGQCPTGTFTIAFQPPAVEYGEVYNTDYPVQFLFTGKAHPHDGAGQGLIKRIIEISRRPEFLGKIIFLENYDMQLARRLVSGVDIWLNTPTRPLEASGTSGEKALILLIKPWPAPSCG